MKKRIDIPVWMFLVLWFLGMIVPFAILLVSRLTAIVLGIVFSMIWLVVMPKTCLSGGFIAFYMAMFQLFAGLMWLGLGILILTR